MSIPPPRGEVVRFLAERGLSPKKTLGQNFLADANMRRVLAEAVPRPKAGTPILELAAGFGALTEALVARGDRVLAVDFDPDMVAALESRRATDPRFAAAVAVRLDDAVTLNVAALAETAQLPPHHRWVVAGNLPYQASGPILFSLLAQRRHIQTACVMLQREVGQRLVATPGSADYGILAVRFRQAATVRITRKVPATCFLPVPKVESVFLRIDFPEQDPLSVGDDAIFAEVVKAAFGQRRKTLGNALRGLSPIGVGAESLALCGIDSGLRAEQLTPAQFVALADAVMRLRRDMAPAAPSRSPHQ